MIDSRIQPPFYTQLENPNKNISLIGAVEYAKQIRKNQNKLLQRLVNSNNKFALSKMRSAEEQQAHQEMLENLYKPITSAIKNSAKGIVDQIEGTYGLSKAEFDELGKLLENYNKLSRLKQQRILTLFDKSDLSMEDRSRLLGIAGNKDPADDQIIQQRFDDNRNDKSADDSDKLEWDSSDLSRPTDYLDSTSKIKFTPIHNSDHVPNHGFASTEFSNSTQNPDLTNKHMDTTIRISDTTKPKDFDISFTPKTDNSPPGSVISIDDLKSSRSKLKPVEIPSTSKDADKNKSLIPGQETLKKTSFPDLPRYYVVDRIDIDKLNEQMNEFLNDKMLGGRPRNRKITFKDMKGDKKNQFQTDNPMFVNSPRQERDLQLSTPIDYYIDRLLLDRALKRDNRSDKQRTDFFRKFSNTGTYSPYNLYKEKYDFISENFSPKTWRAYFKHLQVNDDEGIDGEGLKKIIRRKNKKIGTSIQKSTKVLYLPSDSKSLHNLFEKGISSLKAGNKSNNVKNQLSSILDRFVEMGELSGKERLTILKQYIEK